MLLLVIDLTVVVMLVIEYLNYFVMLYVFDVVCLFLSGRYLYG